MALRSKSRKTKSETMILTIMLQCFRNKGDDFDNLEETQPQSPSLKVRCWLLSKGTCQAPGPLEKEELRHDRAGLSRNLSSDMV